jgi:hypothetical protein
VGQGRRLGGFDVLPGGVHQTARDRHLGREDVQREHRAADRLSQKRSLQHLSAFGQSSE